MIHYTYMIHCMCNIATNITSRMIVAKKTINSNNRTSSLADPFPMTFEYLLLKKNPWCLPFRLHAPKLPYIPVKCGPQLDGALSSVCYIPCRDSDTQIINCMVQSPP